MKKWPLALNTLWYLARIKSMFRIGEIKQMEIPTAEFAFTEYTQVMKTHRTKAYDKKESILNAVIIESSAHCCLNPNH